MPHTKLSAAESDRITQNASTLLELPYGGHPGNQARAVVFGEKHLFILGEKSLWIADLTTLSWRESRSELAGFYLLLDAGHDSVWVGGENGLARVSADGEIERIDSTAAGIGSVLALAPGPHEGELVFFREGDARLLLRSAGGTWQSRSVLRRDGYTPNRVVRIGQELWCAGSSPSPLRFHWEKAAGADYEVLREAPSPGSPLKNAEEHAGTLAAYQGSAAMYGISPGLRLWKGDSWVEAKAFGLWSIQNLAEAPEGRSGRTYAIAAHRRLQGIGVLALIATEPGDPDKIVPIRFPALNQPGMLLGAKQTWDKESGTVLWLLGKDRLWRVPESQLPPDETKLSSYLRWVGVDGQTYPEGVFMNRGSVDLPPRTRSLSLYFVTAGTGGNATGYIQWRKGGAREEWSQPLSEHTLILSDLGEGAHDYEVRLVDNFGRATPATRLQFNIPPPWYLTRESYMATAAFALLLVLGFLWMRNRRLKRLNERMNRLVYERTRELEMQSTAKSEFLATISHEIRNPLNGVLGIVSQLEREPLNESARELTDALKGCARNLSHVFAQVLEFSKLETQASAPLREEPLALVALLREIVSDYSWPARQRGVDLELSVAEGFSDGFVGDAYRIRTVIGNFVSNAIKYAPGGPVTLSLEALPGKDERAEVFIEVNDSGQGIPPEEQELIFGKFVRGTQAKNASVSGLGLGLSICALLAREMGGHVGVESEPGKGSSFFLRLELQRTQAPLKKEPVANELARASVLIVEDERYNQTVLVGFMREAGHKPTAVSSVEEAKTSLQRQRFDAVLLDWDLPGANGGELVRWARSQAGLGATRFLVVTGHDSEEVRSRCQESGADAFLLKPVDAGTLERTLRLSRARMGGEPMIEAADSRRAFGAEQARRSFDAHALATGSDPVFAARRYLETLTWEAEQAAARGAEKNYAALAVHAHKLRSLGGLAGEQSLNEAAAKLETAARDANAPDALRQERLAALLGEVDKFKTRLRAVLQRPSSDGQSPSPGRNE